MMKKIPAFSLVELLIVMAIIAIMATWATPMFTNKIIRAEIQEGINLIKPLQESIVEFYRYTKKFPSDNLTAGVPPAEKIIGNYVTRVDVEDGAIQITYGNKINKPEVGHILTMRPMVVPDSPGSPVSWLCGLASIPQGLAPVGINRTSVSRINLPINCRR